MGRSIERPLEVRQLELLYRRHRRRVRWVLRAQGIAGADLDDAVHDVFLAIHRRHADRDPELDESLWVLGVARNVAFSQRRGRARRRRMLDELPEPEPARGPHEHVARREAWRRLEAFLHTLAEEQREVFVLMDVLGMATAEVAAVTGAPANTVSSRLRLARRRFDRCFAGQAEGQRLRAAVAGERPTPARQRRTWSRLVVAVGIPSGAATTSTIATTAAGSVVVAKWMTGIAAAAILAMGARILTTDPPRPKAPSPAVTIRDPRPAAAPRPRAGTGTSTAVQGPSPLASMQALEAEGSRSASAALSKTTPKVAARVPRPPPSSAAPDELATALAQLRAAEARLASGDPQAALTTLDALAASSEPAVLHRDRVRIERRAACALGKTARAEAAHDELMRLGLVTASESACP